MSWIKTLGYDEADSKLRKIYDRVVGPGQQIDNILAAHSLKPHTLVGHMTLYKSVLHHSSNSNPKSLLEILGVWVSLLNGCDYCVEHHATGLHRLLANDEHHYEIMSALKNSLRSSDIDADVFSAREMAAIRYARTLTMTPSELEPLSIDELRGAGFDDGEILEINQVVSYFAYANRTVLGLGVNIHGETLGLSPNDSDDPSNWNHA